MAKIQYVDYTGIGLLVQQINKVIIDTSIQTVSILPGTNNGTIKLTIDGVVTNNIAVKGLNTAAYQPINAFATAAQGSKADNAISAVASGTTNGTISITKNGTASNIAVKGLGSAAYTNSNAYATSAQGVLATNAMPKGGGTFTGNVLLKGDPVSALMAATKQYVDSFVSSAISASDAMIFKGTLGTGGTISSLPSSANIGNTYKVITATSVPAGSSYTGSTVSAKIGDMIVAMTKTPTWLVVPSGDETVTTVKYSTTSTNLSTTAQSGGITLGFAASKQVDTSIAVASASEALPTSKAVAAFVEGKKYITTDNKVTNTLNATSKAYITGTTSATTNTGGQIFDTGVYLGTTGGELVAARFTGNLNGNANTASSAAKWTTARTLALTGSVMGSVSIDGSGNVSLATTTNHTHNYLPLTGGTLTGGLFMQNYCVYFTPKATGGSAFGNTVRNSGSSDCAGGIGFMCNEGKLTGLYMGLGVSPWEAKNGLFIDTSNVRYKGNVIWHTGNDGTGSGLDADLLDGKHSSAFALASHTHNYAGSTSAGGVANSAVKLTTTRKIGNASFNGTADISLSAIGAAPASHSHGYLPLSGGTMSGTITSSKTTTTYLAGNQGTCIINSTAAAGAYTMLAKLNSTNGFFTVGSYQDTYLLQYTEKSTVTAGTNSVTKSVTLLNESGNTIFPGTVTAPSFAGVSTSTTKLATARNITIGSSKKSFNGTADIAYTLAEIGASATNHTHSYIPLSGSTAISGNLEFSNSGTTARGIIGTMGDNDFWRMIGGATTANAGYLEIATADDGKEPIYFRQYSAGKFITLKRTLTLLDASGNTSLPGSLSVAENVTVAQNVVIGNCTLKYDSTNKSLDFMFD